MEAKSHTADDARIAAERDLYRALLDLGRRDEVEEFLPEALALLCTACGARKGYLEIVDPSGGGAVRFWAAHGLDGEEIGAVRSQLSRGILAETVASGRTLQTASARNDPRFRERRSVQRLRIEAVLCVTVGRPGALGVACLQDRGTLGPFGDADVARVEFAARCLGPAIDRLLLRLRATPEADATAAARRAIPAERLVGRSPALAAALRDASVVLHSDVNVLITGDTGTGKTELARELWRLGPRASGPLVELNCGAIPAQLVEQELFGAAAGAHSAALQRVGGKVAAAEGGVLVLDEIGELPPDSQAKLLQLVEQRAYYPLGSAQLQRADVRIIAATNIDLEMAVRERRFRADLYWRLATFPIRMPTVAERPLDIPLIAESLCTRHAAAHGAPALALAEPALAAIRAAEWPGNVRELSGRIEAGVLRAAHEGTTHVLVRHVFPERGHAPPDPADAPDAARPAVPEAAAATSTEAARPAGTWHEATQGFQRELLVKALADADGNVSDAARRLGLARSHMYSLLELHRLRRP